MAANEINENELILKVDFYSLESLDKFIDLLKDNNIDCKDIGKNEYLVKIYLLICNLIFIFFIIINISTLILSYRYFF